MTELNSPPIYYDDLELSFEKLWGLVATGASNRHSPAHMPAVGTVDASGAPQLRIMVLRDVARDQRALRFHTDSRSVKADQLRHNPATSVLIYDPAEKVQIRLSGIAQLLSAGDLADDAWSGSTPFARRCYMANAAPGTPLVKSSSGLPEWIEGKQPDDAQLAPFRSNFTALLVEIDTVEWLYLANAGHRRARWQWDKVQNLWAGSWLVP